MNGASNRRDTLNERTPFDAIIDSYIQDHHRPDADHETEKYEAWLYGFETQHTIDADLVLASESARFILWVLNNWEVAYPETAPDFSDQ